MNTLFLLEYGDALMPNFMLTVSIHGGTYIYDFI